MRRRYVVHNTFEAGQADAQFGRRSDADLWLLTAEELTNVRLVNGGGFCRRPGLGRIASTAGPTRLQRFVSRDGTKRRLALRNAALDVYLEDRSLSATVTSGVPWLTADLQAMQFAAENDRLFVTSRAFTPHTITWTGAAFVVAPLAFYARTDGSVGQPYWRFSSTRGVVLTPSALTGSITLQADVGSAIFVAGHVGARFRIYGREIEITAVTDGDTATGTVITPLYPTRRITVASSAQFAVGDQCLTTVDDIECEVVNIPNGTQVDVNLTAGFTDPTTSSNTLIGPNGSSAISAVGAAAAIYGTTQWDEQMISAVRGYPGGCGYHKGRLVLLDFPGAPEIHALSVLREPTDFDTGEADDADAIIDGIGDAVGRRARHVVSSEQLVTLTEVGSYYAGEGPNTPVTATTVEFLKIGPEPATTCNPVLASEGIIFSESQGDRLMLLAPTGQLRRVWGAQEILAIAADLLDEPSRLLLVDGSTMGPERYLLAVNADGTITCVHYRRDTEVAGATPWVTAGTFYDVELMGREVWACVNRGGSYSIEYFDPDRLLDNSVLHTNVSPAAPTQAAWANRTVALVWRTSENVTYTNKDGSTRVVTEQRRADIGLFAANGSGALTTAPTASRTYEGGTRFAVMVRLWSPVDPERGPSEHARIACASIDVLTSGMFYAKGQRFTAYRAADDLSQPAPLRTGWRRRKYSGRKRDISFEISQIEAEPLQVRTVTLEVA